jgi:hypothetical protein
MRIHLSIENPTPEILQALAGFVTATPLTEPDMASGPATDTAGQEPDAPSTPEETASSQNTGSTGDVDPVDALIADLDSKYRRAKTVTLKGGVSGSEGDEVTTDDGREGLLEAVYRGRAVVSFEDGTAEELGSSTLTKAVAGDETPPEPKTEEPSTGRRRQSSGSEPSGTVADFAKLPAELQASLLNEFQMKSIAEYKELEGEDLSDFDSCVAEELQNL